VLRRRGDATVEGTPGYALTGRLACEKGDGAHGRTPGAKILGRESFAVAAHHLAQVVVDHAGVDGLALAGVVDILKQLLTRQLLALADDAREAAIVEHQLLDTPALALEREERAAVLQELHVAIAQRGQPVGFVGARVLFVADAQQRLVEQPHDGRKHFVLRQPRQREVLLQAPTQPRQLRAELAHARELAVITGLTPLRVITILLALPRIAARRLQVPARLAANPHVGVRGRDRELPDAVERARCGHWPAICAEILEVSAAALAPDAGLGVGNVDQAAGARVPACLNDRRREFTVSGRGHDASAASPNRRARSRAPAGCGSRPLPA
jgi:hypothetical protein